jgi:RNA methyltransferase, TrmH family
LGARHPSIQRLRRLSGRRAARLEEGAFVIDGPTLVRDALDAGLALEELFVVDGTDAELIAAAEAAGAAAHLVRAEVLARASDTVTSQGVAAIAVVPAASIESAIAASVAGPLALVLVDVQDPGNAGTLLRAAEAAGAAAVLFCGTSVDPWSPKCVRASAGAVFHLPVAIGGEATTVLAELADNGVRTVATVVRDGAPYDHLDLTVPVAVVLGSEAHGLPPAIVDLVDDRATIPMAGRSESLNVAMAGSILAFESLRQRRAQP